MFETSLNEDTKPYMVVKNHNINHILNVPLHIEFGSYDHIKTTISPGQHVKIEVHTRYGIDHFTYDTHEITRHLKYICALAEEAIQRKYKIL